MIRPVSLSSDPMEKILEAIQNGATGDQLAGIPLPTSYRAAHVLKSEEKMWDGVP
ncbi:MAG: hypothetical protein RL430_1125, partial [Actinomycetota bacterium]